MASHASRKIRTAASDDQRAFEHGREILSLVVAEGVALVGRLRADAHGDERGDGRHDVDDAFERVGIERDTARPEIGEILEPHDGKRHGDAGQRHAANSVEAQSASAVSCSGRGLC